MNEQLRPIHFPTQQQEVLSLLRQGHTYKDIAAELCTTLKSLKSNALRSIRNKTGLSTLEDIRKYAQDNGFGESEAKIC